AAQDTDADYPSSRYSWYCMGVIVFAYFFGFMDRIIVGLLTPAIQLDLGFTDTQMGIIQGLAFALFYTLFVIPIGWAADRYNRKWMLTTGVAVWSLFTAGCGLVRSFTGLFGMRVGVGIGEATLNPCTASLIGDYFPPRSRPRAFGIYTMATAFGTGLTYVFGGLLIAFTGAFANEVAMFNMPFLGQIPAWQAVFIIIGIAGLIPALLMAFTVREPKRKEFAKDKSDKASWAEIFAFLKQNKTTLICHHFGVAFILMAVYGWVNWMPSLFSRVHEWTVPEFSLWYGIFGGLFGIVSAISSGFVTIWFKDNGKADGAMRTVLWGGAGLTIGTTIAPLMPSPELCIAAFAIAGVFSNWPPAQALAAVNEMTPNQLRGVVTSVYILVIGIGGAGLGPFAMGWVTDNVFGDPNQIHYSMALVTVVMGSLGTLLIAYGLKAYRESLSRVDWMTGGNPLEVAGTKA
ncbi:MAG: MFS transporter, partial [Rhodospirillaceae bacterium]